MGSARGAGMIVVAVALAGCPRAPSATESAGAGAGAGRDASASASASASAGSGAGAAEDAWAGAGEDAGGGGDSGADAGEPEEGRLGVVDLHVDLGWQVHANRARLSDLGRQASLAKIQKGEVGTLVVPLFVDRAYAMKPAEARAAYDATFADLARAAAGEGAGVLSAPLAAPQQGRVRLRVSFEGMDGFADDVPGALAWVGRGACLFGLVHSRSNALGGASMDPDAAARARGLTDKGKALAAALVARGGVLDGAHASDPTFDDLAAIAEAKGAPIVDTHTGARALADIPRNLDDERARRIGRSGGVIGVSLYTGHLRATSDRTAGKVTLDDYVRHLEHLKSVAGAGAIAIGSDLEGAITEPEGSLGAATWPVLAARLRARGWSERDVRALFRGNAERVFAWAESRGCGRP